MRDSFMVMVCMWPLCMPQSATHPSLCLCSILSRVCSKYGILPQYTPVDYSYVCWITIAVLYVQIPTCWWPPALYTRLTPIGSFVRGLC